MTKKDYILKAKIYNPEYSLDSLENIARELEDRWYLTKEIKHRTNLPEKKTWLTPSQIAKAYFTEWPEWEVHKRLIQINWDIKDELSKFDSYWTELNKSWTQQRWQQQKTFEVQRRLATWLNNNKTKSNLGQKTLTMI